MQSIYMLQEVEMALSLIRKFNCEFKLANASQLKFGGEVCNIPPHGGTRVLYTLLLLPSL